MRLPPGAELRSRRIYKMVPSQENAISHSSKRQFVEGESLVEHRLVGLGTLDSFVGRTGAGQDLEAAGEAVKHDLGRGVVLAVLGRPGAGTDLAFQRHQRAFAGTALDHIDQSFVPYDDAVPFGAFLTFGDL